MRKQVHAQSICGFSYKSEFEVRSIVTLWDC